MRIKSYLVILCLFAFWLTCGFADKDRVNSVLYAGAFTDVYAEADSSSGKIGVLYPLQEVAVIESAGGYSKVALGGASGYVQNADLISYETAKTVLFQVTNGSYTLPVMGYVDRTANSDVIFVGDSRTVQMLEAMQDTEHTWINESKRGYDWFANIAVPIIDGAAREGSKIVVQIGLNDLTRVTEFVQLLNEKALEWESKGAHLYVVSVNPVEYHQTIADGTVVWFNAVMKQSLTPEIQYLDIYSFLAANGYHTVDGVHYDNETYRRIFNYIIYALNPEREDYQAVFQAGESAWKQKNGITETEQDQDQQGETE